MQNIKKTIKKIRPSSIKNFLLNDTLIDYLELNKNSNHKLIKKSKTITNRIIKNESEFGNIIMNKGNIFEDNIMDYLNNHYNVKTVCKTQGDIKESNVSKTLEYLRSGIPLIGQAVISNENIIGCPDLLIRSDWINKIFTNQIDSEEENIGCKLSNKYHYRVIDIKLSKLDMCANGMNIRNSGRVPCYKGQIALYNMLLGELQGYIPNKAYILSPLYKYQDCARFSSGYVRDSFEQLGHIEFNKFDKKYIDLSMKGVEWMQYITENHTKLSCNPPSIPELYPNMKNTNDSPYHHIKSRLAKENNELTSLWMVGMKNRNRCFEQGIYNWMDDRCTSDTLGVGGNRGITLDKILNINRSDNKLISPNKIRNNDYYWKKPNKYDIFVDFELVNSTILDGYDNGYQLLFMIGYAYIEKGKLVYKNICFDTIDEERIMDKFIDILKKFCPDPYKLKMYTWGYCEEGTLRRINYKYSKKWDDYLYGVNFIDMCKIFTDEPIVVKGSLNFGLKNIASAMYNHGMIKTTWNTEIDNGLDAMTYAYKYYNGNNNKRIINNVVKYNKVDCVVLHEILEYIRTKK